MASFPVNPLTPRLTARRHFDRALRSWPQSQETFGQLESRAHSTSRKQHAGPYAVSGSHIGTRKSHSLLNNPARINTKARFRAKLGVGLELNRPATEYRAASGNWIAQDKEVPATYRTVLIQPKICISVRSEQCLCFDSQPGSLFSSPEPSLVLSFPWSHLAGVQISGATEEGR
jgi:hypothetical protein